MQFGSRLHVRARLHSGAELPHRHLPTSVTTQDPLRQRALVVPSKAERVHEFHKSTLHALSELLAAAGLTHPISCARTHHSPHQLNRGHVAGDALQIPQARFTAAEASGHQVFEYYWKRARAESFALASFQQAASAKTISSSLCPQALPLPTLRAAGAGRSIRPVASPSPTGSGPLNAAISKPSFTST